MNNNNTVSTPFKNMFIKTAFTSIALWLSGCATMQDNVSAQDHSGYLSNYDQMESVSTEEGTLLQWFDQSLTSGKYTKIMIDPVVMYQQDTLNLSKEQTEKLDTFTANFDQLLLKSLSSNGELVTKAGPGVARIKPAITNVFTETKGMKAYEAIPIAAIIAGATIAANARDKVIILALETKIEDSQSGKLIGTTLRKGVASQGDNDVTDAEDVSELMGSWAKEGKMIINNLINQKP